MKGTLKYDDSIRRFIGFARPVHPAVRNDAENSLLKRVADWTKDGHTNSLPDLTLSPNNPLL
jgi:hypothetical protein